MRRRLSMLSLLAAAALAAPTTLVGAAPVTAGTTREARLIAKINSVRADHGLRPLRIKADLMRAAESHTRSMAGQRTLFHTASFSSLCCWREVSENVGYAPSVRAAHRQFMRSAPHRANVLDRGMRHVGVGIVSSGGMLWVTEVFRAPS